MDPIQLLQDELKELDMETVMAAVSKLTVIGVALGPARCREDLLPLLAEYAANENDEVHCGIAKQLGSFVELVGGPQYANCLLPLLEKFAAEDETVIRTAACASLCKIIPQLSDEARRNELFPMIQRLVEGEWFTSRCSSCTLLAFSYSMITQPTCQQQMRTWYQTMCRDETPMVRKAALQHFGEFATKLDMKVLVADFVPIVRDTSLDDLDAMRVFAPDACAYIAKVLSADEFQNSIVPVLEALQEDCSWRVRKELAIKLPVLISRMDDKSVPERFALPVFVKLLTDREAEVRLAAANRLGAVCSELKFLTSLADNIEPYLGALSNDAEKNVRVAFAKNLVPMCNFFPKEAAAKLLVPVLQSLSQDEFYGVRRHVIMDLHALTDVGPNGVLAILVPQLLELTKDPKWRVRLAVIEKTAMLAQVLGQRMFERKLQNLIVQSLSDHVAAIREKACEQAAKVVSLFGARWAAERFFPGCFAIYDTNTNYIHRMTCLMLISSVSSEMKDSKDPTLETTFLPIVQQAFTDEVANVRLLAAQSMHKLMPHIKRATLSEKVLPALRTLMSDADKDVVFFALLCQEACAKSGAA